MSRVLCEQCQRPVKVCVCSYIVKQDNYLPVIVIQHEDELSKPLSTVPLIEKSLSRVAVIRSSRITETQLLERLTAWQATKPLLVYPKSLSASAPHICLDYEKQCSHDKALLSSFDTLLLLDGTWRNTREILLANPWLQSLPTLAIQNAPISRYRIRKAGQEGALSTIEALAHILTLLEPNFSADLLLEPFEKMIDTQIACMGEEVFRRNYTE